MIDLLNPSTTKKNLAVRWSKKSRSFFVENLFTVDCEELDDLQAVLEEGNENIRNSIFKLIVTQFWPIDLDRNEKQVDRIA